jgi:hypothetical protein
VSAARNGISVDVTRSTSAEEIQMRNTMRSIHAHVSHTAEVLANVTHNANFTAQTICQFSEGQVLMKDAMLHMAHAVTEMQTHLSMRQDQRDRTISSGGGGVTQLGIASAHWEPSCISYIASSSWLPTEPDVAQPKSPQLATAVEKEHIPVEHIRPQGAASSSIDHDLLAYGTLVKFIDLSARSELNGVFGNINSFDPNRQRYSVTIQSTLEKAWFKRVNLTIEEKGCEDMGSDDSSQSEDQSDVPSEDDDDMVFGTSEAALALLTPEEREEALSLHALYRKRKRKYGKRK